MKLFICTIVLIWAASVHAQQTVLTNLFNTGMDNNNVLLQVGSVDPHYTLITSADKVGTGPNAYAGMGSGWWMANSPNSGWIEPLPTGANPGCVAGGIYIYRTTFDLSQYDAASVSISGSWSTDNEGVDIRVNGNSAGKTAFGFQGWYGFTLTNGFTSGFNTLDFVVHNDGDQPEAGYGGCDLTNMSDPDNPSGLRVELSGVAMYAPPVATVITNINVGPSGGGNLSMSIRGSGFGSTNGVPNALTNLIVYDINPVTGTTNWSVNGGAINITSWTNNEIDIASFNVPFLRRFTTNDQVMVQAQNPETQSGFTTNAVTLNQAFLVIEIAPPVKKIGELSQGMPMLLNDTEMTSLLNEIGAQLNQQGLSSNSFVVTVVPSSSGNLDIRIVDILMDVPLAITEAATDFPELGVWGFSTEVGEDAAFSITPSPLDILNAEYSGILYAIDTNQAALIQNEGCWHLAGGTEQPINKIPYVVECDQELKIIVTLSSIPANGTTIDLSCILGNFLYGYMSTCDFSTVGSDCGAGYVAVQETSFNNSENPSWPTFNEHYIMDILGNTVFDTTVVVPSLTSTPCLLYTITTSPSPAASGTCSGGDFAYSNSIVTVTATPNSCYSFQNWTENGVYLTNSPIYTFTATNSRNLEANFVTNTYTVTTISSPSDGGTTAGANTTNCGDSITLVANANLGYSFASWTCNGNWVTNSSAFTFIVNANSNLVANFVPVGSSMITTIASPSFAGSTTGGGTYTNGQSKTLTAMLSDSCYAFMNWTTNGTPVSGTSTNYTFTVATNQVFTANFAPIPYNIALNSSAGGTASGGNSYNCGTSATIHATSNPCYSFVVWSENNKAVSYVPDYTFTVDASHNFMANFVPNTYSISASSSPSGSGIVSGGGTVDCGTSVTVIATPTNGWQFLNWMANGNVVTNSSSYTFIPMGNQALIAHFVQNNALVGLGFQTNGSFQMDFYGIIGSNFTLQASVDLKSWTSILNFTCTNLPTIVIDPGATYLGWRFYRVVQGTLPILLKLNLNAVPFSKTTGIGLNLQGPLGFDYLIQASTNLVNWQPFTNFIGTNSPVYFTDPTATNYNRRFYRAMMH